jgi:hypothetical protein
LLLPMVLALCGCSVANQAIRADFTEHNTIIHFNQEQQMLLNLVRLHYREMPLFLQAGALSASYESHAGASASYNFETRSPGSITRGLGLDYFFASKPTITYTPVEGKAYVQQFMSPITLDTFGLLVRSGWPVSKLGELLIQKVTIGNEVIFNDPGSANYPRFAALIALLQEAQDAGRLGVVTENGIPVVRAGEQAIPADAWQLRSLFDVMFAAARNTETPTEYLNRVRPGIGNGALLIRATSSCPPDALIWVEHAGYCYSIDNTDLQSKDTFALLIQLSRIQATPITGSPVLTLPVR